MKSNDPARFASELRGDFGEVDAHIRASYLEAIAMLAFLVLWLWLFF